MENRTILNTDASTNNGHFDQGTYNTLQKLDQQTEIMRQNRGEYSDYGNPLVGLLCIYVAIGLILVLTGTMSVTGYLSTTLEIVTTVFKGIWWILCKIVSGLHFEW